MPAIAYIPSISELEGYHSGPLGSLGRFLRFKVFISECSGLGD